VTYTFCHPCGLRAGLSYNWYMRKPLEERFLSKVLCDVQTQCWNWTGAVVNGYGFMFLSWEDGKQTSIYAHRVALLLEGIEVPEGLEVDHLCENTLCVRPAHLDVVPHHENVQRRWDRRRRRQ
jgi:HNH endonuclease